MNTKMDYYLKGLSLEARQRIWGKMETISTATVKNLLEKSKGYSSLRSMGFSDSAINNYLEKASGKFASVNAEMINNRRKPVFSNSNDTFQSAQEYVDATTERTVEELMEIFNCTWDEYVPQEYVDPTDKVDGQDID